MYIEPPICAYKTVSFRTDDEMFYCLKEIAAFYDRSASDVARLALASLISSINRDRPMSWNALRFEVV